MARYTQTINLDWKFHRGEDEQGWYKGLDDSAWRTVTIPHDWSVEEPFSLENSSGTGYLSGGIGWYRKHFYLPEERRGSRVEVIFDGVYNHSRTWCNSYYLGQWAYGYTTYVHDISFQANYGDKENVLSVRVNREKVSDSRWFTGTGIYRKVTVVAKDPVSLDYQGVFFTTPEVSAQRAVAHIENTLTNTTGEAAALVVRNTLLCDCGKVAAQVETSCAVDAGEKITVPQDMEVPEPALWSPDAPNLYTLKTELLRDGQVIDDETTRVGIRSIRFDPNEGFFLNGVNTKFKGVCVHHDAGCLGAAVRPKVWERRLRTLKAMGCNAIRMSHNPHMPELYDLCDSMGFLVMDEAFDEWEGPKNKWSTGHNVYPPKLNGYFEDFHEWHEKDLSLLILRDRNHPSIVMWSIGNEIDYPNDPYCHPLMAEATGNNDANKPAAERKYDPNKACADRLAVIARKLKAIVKRYDTTRPVTAAVAFPELSNQDGYTETLDVVGYNYKEQYYEQDHRLHPDWVLLGSENGGHLDAWKAVRDNAYISGQFLWTGIDFLGEAHGWPIHGSMAGRLTLAGFPKADYYFRRSLWAQEPVAQLVTARKIPDDVPRWFRRMGDAFSWNYMDGEEVDVICYTNCERAELFLNGRSLGEKKLADFPEEYISWKVPFQAGKLEVVATTACGCQVRSELVTAMAPSGFDVCVCDPVIRADGEDIAQIEIRIVDGAGNFVPTASDMVQVKVEGAGTLLGIESGDLADNTAYTAPERRAYRGNLLVIVKAGTEAGDIRVTLRGQNLQEKIVTVKAE